MLGRLLLGAGGSGNLVSDAHLATLATLATLAIEYCADLGTFDCDFARFTSFAGMRPQLLT